MCQASVLPELCRFSVFLNICMYEVGLLFHVPGMFCITENFCYLSVIDK